MEPPIDKVRCDHCGFMLPIEWSKGKPSTPNQHHTVEAIHSEQSFTPTGVLITGCGLPKRIPGVPDQNQSQPVVHPSGAHRSELMPHYASIDANFLWRLAQIHTGAPKGTERLDQRTGFHYHGGDLGYGRGNWHKGLPLVDTFGHLMVHLYSWLDIVESGVTPHADELGAAAWNIEVLMRFESQYIEEAKQARRAAALTQVLKDVKADREDPNAR